MSTLIRRRPKRFSRFRSRNLGPHPRFVTGDQAGEFNILEYLGYSSVKPGKDPKMLKVWHHWYRVRCSCGTEETHTQQQLIDTRRQRVCAECQTKLKEI
jgi:hypothetical protein